MSDYRNEYQQANLNQIIRDGVASICHHATIGHNNTPTPDRIRHLADRLEAGTWKQFWYPAAHVPKIAAAARMHADSLEDPSNPFADLT